MDPIAYVSLQKKFDKRSIPTLFGHPKQQLPNLECRSHAKNPTLVKYQVSDRRKNKSPKIETEPEIILKKRKGTRQFLSISYGSFPKLL